MFRGRLTFPQMACATVLGIAGGFYIYKPYFDQSVKNLGQQNQDAPKKQEGTD
ncbi:protein PIGBOS1-like [Nematolebias whitei]|uniref:protein PIGBOS1-like n=1 Tax=Nematolebias whitei TaxID=451745 RepID=UPI00189BD77E|nr:protein PIGBOS1-like [Nematolebias whitei]